MAELLNEVRFDKDILTMFWLDDDIQHIYSAIMQSMEYLMGGVEIDLDEYEDANALLIADAIIKKNRQLLFSCHALLQYRMHESVFEGIVQAVFG